MSMTKAQFFKYLTDGGKVEIISFHNGEVPSKMRGVKWAVKVQTNAIKFNNDSWLYKGDIDAKDVHNVAIGGTSPGVSVGWAIYKLVDKV